jgi:hypothetical protein
MIKDRARAVLAKATVSVLAVAGAGIALAAPAYASCNTTGTLDGIHYFSSATGCSGFLFSETGATGAGNLGSNNLDVCSLLMPKDGTQGVRWITDLWDQINEGWNAVGFTNVSTTANKLYDLQNYGRGGGTWCDAPRSLDVRQDLP